MKSLAELVLTEQDIRVLIEFRKEILKETIDNGCDRIIPVISALCYDAYVGNKKEMLFGIAIDFNTHEQKEIIMKSIARQCIKQRLIPIAVIMSCEGWMVKTNNIINVPPSQHPDKQEVVLIQLMTIDKRAYMITGVITRAKDNKIIVNKFDEDTKVQANLLSIVFAHFFEEMKLREESAELPELPELPGIHLN